MNDARDPNLIIDSWLDEGPTDLPESTRRAITTSVRTVNQKRGFGLPWMRPARAPPAGAPRGGARCGPRGGVSLRTVRVE